MEIDEDKLYNRAVLKLSGKEFREILLNVANSLEKVKKEHPILDLSGLAQSFRAAAEQIDDYRKFPAARLLVNEGKTPIPMGYFLATSEKHREKDRRMYGIIDSGHYAQLESDEEGETWWVVHGHSVTDKDNVSHESYVSVPLQRKGQWHLIIAPQKYEGDEPFIHMGANTLLIGYREGEVKTHHLSTGDFRGDLRLLYLIYNHEKLGPIIVPLDTEIHLQPYANLSEEERQRLFRGPKQGEHDLTFI